MPRTIVVTGASSGVGLAAAEQFAAQGDRVVLVGRNPDRLAAAVDRVGHGADSYRADFERLAEVRALAAYLRERYPTIDVLANNAGGMVGERRITVDGFEATMQGNFLAPYLLTGLLRDRLAGGRVVNTASDAHRGSPLDPADFTATNWKFGSWRTYGAAKAANILFAAEAARRWPDVFSVSFHPGVVRTNFGEGPLTRLFFTYAPFLSTPERAGARLVFLATAPAGELVNGGYYVNDKLAKPNRPADDPATATRLWDASAQAVGQADAREPS